jgi:NADP-dependent 3-hydroxy acid dehydrogenase YdfG/quinol monooxygenase YgiN
MEFGPVEVLVRFSVKQDRLDAFKDLARGHVVSSLADDGCITYELMLSDSANTDKIVWIYEVWETWEHFRLHQQSAHLEEFRTARSDLIMEYWSHVFPSVHKPKLSRRLNVVLTGATGGIGREIAAALNGVATHVLLTGRDGSELSKLCKSLEICDGRTQFTFLPLDLLNAKDVDEFGRLALNLLDGDLDVLIHNAGLAYHSSVEMLNQDELQEMFQVNTLSPIVLTSQLLPSLMKSENPSIIAVSSILGSSAMALTAAYTSTKHALTGFFRCLRLETSSQNLRVTLIEPGAVETDFLDGTHDASARLAFTNRSLRRLPPEQVAQWVLHAVVAEPGLCPEKIRITPIGQAL